MWRRSCLLSRCCWSILLSACCADGRRRPEVVASFYPLQYVAERVVGGHAEGTQT